MKQPLEKQKNRCQNWREPNSIQLPSSSDCRHSLPMDTTLTVIMTLPASAKEKAMVPLLTCRFDDSFEVLGWRKTTAAPMQVDAPAMQER
mmetsp:Transcript_38326/g.58186  ORF Transcript_38326/g.58186 Transcript_38326/m.58186 type:complete len:90 (+) Transcript_38326:544-813(+)